MSNVIPFPKIVNSPLPLPRERVFHIGFRDGCDRFEPLYLKRNGVLHGIRYWEMTTYDLSKKYYAPVKVLEECPDDCVPIMLEMFGMQHKVSFADLRKMGWGGKSYEPAIIYTLQSAQYTEQ